MNLQLFLSDRCSMSCDYCFLSLNRGPAAVLPLAAAKAAIDAHVRREGPGAAVTVLGGEPWVHYALLKDVLAHAAARGARAAVVTNGARLCPRTLGEVRALGADVTVSLDGRAEAHDRHRTLLGGGSAWEETMKALEACDKAALRANMVVCADTAGALLANVEALRAAGFRRVSFHLNVLERWTDASLEALAASLAGLARYARALKPGQLGLAHLSAFAAPSSEPADEDLILGADGRYYPCDGLFARPYAELGDWAVGDAASGPDWEARAARLEEARRALRPLLGPSFYSWPREAYFHARVTGADPAPAVRSFHRADEVLGRALSALAAGEAEAHARG